MVTMPVMLAVREVMALVKSLHVVCCVLAPSFNYTQVCFEPFVSSVRSLNRGGLFGLQVLGTSLAMLDPFLATHEHVTRP